MRLKKEACRYSSEKIHITCESKIDLIGLMDSYGVPYSSSVENSFMDYLEKDLREQDKLGSSLNLFNLYANKSWQMNGVFNNRVTIGEFNTIQNFSLDYMRHKFPGQIKDELKYSKDAELEDISIYEYVSSKDCPVIIYSCVANDIFYYFDASPTSLTPKKCLEIATHFNQETKTIGKHVSGNIQTILDCNPNASIYVMGLYLPSDNYFLHFVAGDVIRKFNKEIEKACKDYANVYYIDVSCLSFYVLEGDFHPNADGQYVIYVKIAEETKTHPLPNPFRVGKPVLYSQDNCDSSIGDLSETSKCLYEKVFQSNLPMNDYVECAVAIEWGLNECDFQNLSYKDLSAVKDYFINNIREDSLIETFSLAFDVEIVEKKIVNNIVECENSMTPDVMKNDKISLVEYQKQVSAH